MPARRNNTAQANGPHSAPHAAPSPQPATTAAPPAGSPAAATWAALTAVPGATATQIATAAGTSRAIASRELAALETNGQATRTPRERTGRATAPTTWQPAPSAASGTGPAGPDATSLDETAGAPAASPAPAGDGHLPIRGSDPAPGEADGSPPDTEAPGSTATDAPAASKTAPAPADGASPGDEAAPDTGIPDDSAADAPAAGDAAAPASADSEPQPAPAGEAAELLRHEVASAATQAADVLDNGDTATALAAMDAICTAAAQTRRLLKAATSGRKPRGTTSPAPRPGQLRDLVHAHLAEHPDADFTPHAIGRVLARSSGAVANALDRLTALGNAQLTSDKPRRYRHQAATQSAPTPAV
jgi:hypothetical protein